MTLEIRLIGHPAVKINGKAQAPPKGRKTSGLLAYLILADRHPARSWLAGLLFADADDPLGALRWTLAELRRLLGDGVKLGGDPVTLAFPPESFVDVRASRPGLTSEENRSLVRSTFVTISARGICQQ